MTDFELLLVLIVSLLVLLTFILLYKELFFIAYDEEAARLAGVPVRLVNFIFTLMTAVTVSIAARTVGALIVSSLLVIPVVCAMQFGRSYRQTVLLAVGFALVFTVLGLTVAFYAGLKPGGTIVLASVACLLLILLYKKIFNKVTRTILIENEE